MILIERLRRDNTKWHLWFAWRPVMVWEERKWDEHFPYQYRIIWLEYVERRGFGSFGMCEYREVVLQ